MVAPRVRPAIHILRWYGTFVTTAEPTLCTMRKETQGSQRAARRCAVLWVLTKMGPHVHPTVLHSMISLS